MSHTKTVCKECGIVIMQCRCMCADKVIEYKTCKKCLEKLENRLKKIIHGSVE